MVLIPKSQRPHECENTGDVRHDCIDRTIYFANGSSGFVHRFVLQMKALREYALPECCELTAAAQSDVLRPEYSCYILFRASVLVQSVLW